MKLDYIRANNFLRLNLIEVDLSDATVHFFAGDNDAGKSSLQEAIRFAMLGETVRVKKKGDYRLMVRDGAKKGMVGMTVDGIELIRDVKSGDLGGTAGTWQGPEYLPYVLNAQHFAQEKPAVRRAFLMELTGTKVNRDNVCKRMKAKGVAESCIETVKPILRSGIPAGHKEAEARATDARSQWVGLTGKPRYGSQIAADWTPEVPEDYDPQALLDGEDQLTSLNKSIGSLNIEKGRIMAQLEDARQALADHSQVGEERQQPGEDDPEQITKMEKVIGKLEKRRQALNSTLAELNRQSADAREKAPVTCCECGALLRVSFESSKVQVSRFTPLSDAELAALQGEIVKTSTECGGVERKLSSLREQIGAIRALETATPERPSPTVEDIERLSAQLKDIEVNLTYRSESLGTLGASVEALRTAAIKVRDAKGIKERAQLLHQSVQDWEGCKEALAPDGIPAEILSDTLKPVNDRLRATSLITGWPQVSIDPTIEVLADGRRYELLGESARWRADAAIADAIAYLSGIGFLVLDRVDVLSVANRAQFMRWINEIQSDYESVILFGTLQSIPAALEKHGMKGHWLVDGEIQEAV